MVKATDLFGVENLDDETRMMLHKGLKHLRRIRVEENAAE